MNFLGLSKLVLGLWLGAFLFTVSCQSGSKDEAAVGDEVAEESSLISFAVSPIDTTTAEGKMAEYGERLVKETYNYFYTGDKKIGNHLSCKSCHLDGGTKPFAAPYVGLTSVFPIYIGRENKIVSLEERINGCFERSMNGKAIPLDSKEMRAMVTYMKHLSKGSISGSRTEGQGFVAFTAPERAVNLESGKEVYIQHCQSCHMENGDGMQIPGEKGYLYPPLWGPDSYNDGAGMNRVLTAAKFIKGNMPLGTVYNAPQLTDEEAYDVAGYINSHSRPSKANKQLDYPDLSKKPKDSPYPPFNDDLPQERHKFGPFNF